jgi:protoporphyrinogen oxidase
VLGSREAVSALARENVRHVVVMGAGPAGLAAGHELSAHGVDVTVLERAPWVGGLSLTWERDGFKFDLGGHRWFTKEEWLDEWFRTLMQGQLVTVDRISRIYFGGKYFDYPIRIGNVLRTAGPITSVQAVLSYAWALVTRMLWPTEIRTIRQAYEEQFGPVLYRMFFRRYTEKVWGRSCDELSSAWVAQRAKGLSIWGTVRNALLPPRYRAAGSKRVESLVDTFLYPRHGYQRISEQMQKNIEARGGRVLLNSRVTGVRVDGGRTFVGFKNREHGSTHEIECDHAVSTIPLGKLVQILDPEPPSSVIDASKGLEFRSVMTANIMLRREQVTRDTWLYVHDDRLGFARIHEPKNWSEAMVPSGTTSICAEWFCTEGDEIWRLPDEEVVERTVRHLADDLGFIDRSELIDGFVLRARDAYPVYSLDYAERVSTIKDYLQRFEHAISIAGRGGTFRYNNADHSIETGILVAQNLFGFSHDVDAVNREQDYHEEKVVGR